MIYNKETIKSLPVHTSLMPPCIADLITGRKAVFSMGGPTIDIDESVTIEDVMKRWKRWESDSRKKAKEVGYKEWTVEGKKTNYLVTLENGNYSCTCPGFRFRGKCKHIEQIKNGKIN